MSPTHSRPLQPEQLHHRCDPEQFGFATTAELEDLKEVIGQDRAIEAIRFGIGIRKDGYNLFAMGPAGCGARDVVRTFVQARAAQGPVPPDLCYVHNFRQAHRPRAIELPAGRAPRFALEMERLVEELRIAIPAAFETDEYRARRHEIEAEFGERQDHAFAQLQERARQKNVTLVRTPGGVALAPVHDGEVMDPEAYGKLPEERRRGIEAEIASLGVELEKTIHQIPRWRREAQHKIRELNRVVTRSAVNSLIDEMKKEYADVALIPDYLDQVQQDIVDNAEDFRQVKDREEPSPFGALLPKPEPAGRALSRYRVNVLIAREAGGEPVVFEDNPTYTNLVGRIEHTSQMGVLETDFTLIKPGALHKANGGYLVVEALKLLAQPFAWEGLKRALRSHAVQIESLGQMLSLVSTVSLEPEPVPLKLKVVMLGERWVYHLLHAADPEFGELFKVAVDFATDMPREPATGLQYARLIAGLSRKEELRPLDRAAVARVIEHGSRLAGRAGKVSMEISLLADLLRESDYWASQGGRALIGASDVQRAIDAQTYRADRVRERYQEEIRAKTILIDTDGEKVGQVNGLSVVKLGGFMFGHPARITARVRIGGGKVVDIEREVELGGPIHSKGVLILSGFLASRYATDRPLSLAASLVFEQSYGGVEGDSASTAELLALLSALSGAPARQSCAVTGSVNQNGQVQAIGGVNEKIEGFFDVCRGAGLTGAQGVIIPESNVQDLMLRSDVVEAAAAGRFRIYPVTTVDEAVEILMGQPAGERDARGKFPEGSINEKVERRLEEFAERALAWRARHGESA